MPAQDDPIDADAYLQRQSQEARAAMGKTLQLLKTELGQGLDPRGWTRQHPWLMLGSTAATGFLAAKVILPSRQRRRMQRLAELERALRRSRKMADPMESSRSRGLMTRLARIALKSIRPALLSMVTAGITAKKTQESSEKAPASPPRAPYPTRPASVHEPLAEPAAAP